jgi:hypothetical protein
MAACVLKLLVYLLSVTRLLDVNVFSGGPLDIMQRRVLCAGTRTLALSIARSVQQMTLESD